MADPRKSPSWKNVLAAQKLMKRARQLNDKEAFAEANADYEKAMAACQEEQGALPGPKFRRLMEKMAPVPPDPHQALPAGVPPVTARPVAEKAAAEKTAAEKAAAEKAAAEKAAAGEGSLPRRPPPRRCRRERRGGKGCRRKGLVAEKADTKPETPSAKGKKKSKKKEK